MQTISDYTAICDKYIQIQNTTDLWFEDHTHFEYK